MNNLNNNNVINNDQLFDNKFIEVKALYHYHFNILPSLNFISQLDGEKAFIAFKEKFAEYIKYEYQYRWYKHERKNFQFYKTVIVLKNKCLIEFESDFCEILHDGKQTEFINQVSLFVMKFKERKKRRPSEINLIVRDTDGLALKVLEIKRTNLDLNLFYENDFIAVNEVIRKRLAQKNDKGIVLLHGLPGTGKTTYLRHLIGKIKKRVLFLSPDIAGNLMSPDFMDLLINNPNIVLVIEDAENIITDRRLGSDSSVSNLLNISDGLLADFLNVQLICTFNSPLTMVDSALMRKGRLIAKYEFGKLSIAKSQKLSDHLGFKNLITMPMTVAEITNQHEKEFETKQVKVMGFRRDKMMEINQIISDSLLKTNEQD